MVEMMQYFSTSDRPVKPGEFKAFWNSLETDDQKSFYRIGIGQLLGLS